jgi:battenin
MTIGTSPTLSSSIKKYQPVSNDVGLEDANDENDISLSPIGSSTAPKSVSHWDFFLCFWVLGLFNNSSYVIMIACAKNISEGGTALVFLANIFPSLAVKLSAPYWFDHVSYRKRMLFATLSMIASLSLVASNSSSTGNFALAWQLMGVGLGSLQGGLGEASLLALAGKCDGEKKSKNDNDQTKLESKGQCLTCFSSGTGMAGVFGFFWKWFWSDYLTLSVSTMLWLAMVIPAGYWLTFRHIIWKESILYPPTSSIETVQDDESLHEIHALNGADPFEQPSDFIEADDDEEEDGSEPNAEFADESTMLEIYPNPINISEMSGTQRFSLVLSLWPYIIPLFTVYAAEYALQSGTWTAIGFPVEDEESRDRFYEFSNWMYQAGVFLSRSSGTLWTAPLWILWVIPGLQSLNVVIFSHVASHTASSILYVPGFLYFGAFYAGLLGGSCYINAYKRICADLPLVHQEFALSSTSVGESLGIVVADILGLFIQACLYKANGLQGAIIQCPL